MLKLSSEIENADIGIILSPHGVGGMVKVYPYSDFPERIMDLKEVWLRKDQGNYQPMTIEKASIFGRFWLVKFIGIEDRDHASNLRNSLITIPLDQRVPLPEGSYYHDQLVGLTVVNGKGEKIGKVVDLLTTGGHDLFVVEADSEKKVLIPAVKEFVKQVDCGSGIIITELPEGLLDL